jgi:4-azaleucine resistance transporter AzlC
MPSPRSEFLSGLKGVLPILVGVIPFGLIYGVIAVDAGLTAAAAQAMSAFVFAGSAQFIAAQLFGLGTPALVIILTIFVVNLRHVLYSASVAPYLQPLSRPWKWALAYLLTDEAYAVTITHYRETNEDKKNHGAAPDNRHWYFLGSGLGLWSTWQISTAVGIYIGAQVPESWSLDFTLALTFIALVVPALKDRGAVAAALAAGISALLFFYLPYKLGLVIAALVGIIAGMLIENRS